MIFQIVGKNDLSLLVHVSIVHMFFGVVYACLITWCPKIKDISVLAQNTCPKAYEVTTNDFTLCYILQIQWNLPKATTLWCTERNVSLWTGCRQSKLKYRSKKRRLVSCNIVAVITWSICHPWQVVVLTGSIVHSGTVVISTVLTIELPWHRRIFWPSNILLSACGCCFVSCIKDFPPPTSYPP